VFVDCLIAMVSARIGALIVGLLIGAAMAFTWAEAHQETFAPLEAEVDEHTTGTRTWMRCRRCNGESNFTASTVDSAVVHRVLFMEGHAGCKR